jgi:hypothetical protein
MHWIVHPSPQVNSYSEPYKIKLFGDWVIAYIIYVKTTSYLIIVGPKSNDWYPYKKAIRSQRQRLEWRSYKPRNLEVAEWQHKLGEKHGTDFLSKPLKGIDFVSILS